MDGGAYEEPSEPEYVYWRRRAVVAAAVLLTVGLIAWSCAGSGGDEERTAGTAGTARPAVGGPSAAQSGASVPVEAGATVTVTATPKPPASRSPSAALSGGRCRDRDVRVALRADADAYDGGDRPEFVLRVTSSRACEIDLGKLRVTITSGPDRIWSSAHCADRKDDAMRKVSPHQPYRDTMTWGRTRSDPDDCGGDQQVRARPGWYVAVARLGDIRSEKTVFQLRG